MVKLSYPITSKTWWWPVVGGASDFALAGPIDLPWLTTSVVKLEQRSQVDHLIEQKGLLGENGVDNIQLIGNFSSLPVLAGSGPSPNFVLYPNGVSDVHVSYDTGSPFPKTVFEQGIISFDTDTLVQVTHDGYTYYRAWYGCFDKTLKEWCHSQYSLTLRTDGTIVSLSVREMRAIERHPSVLGRITCLYRWKSTQGPWPGFLQHDLRGELCQGFIRTVIVLADVPWRLIEDWHAHEFDLVTHYASSMPSPGAIFRSIDEELAWHKLEEFPIAGEQDGLLAAAAVRKLDLIKTNMIEFLSDLRHPLSLIPKLKSLRQIKNLGKLKGLKVLAGDYLQAKYGVLPTISDLGKIYAAMMKRVPSCDKYGNRLTSAMHEESVIDTDGLYHPIHSLQQHIKIAFSEDLAFANIVEKFTRLGLWPTFENLWDMVPYSFAIDWFINVGDFLERVDTRHRIQRLPIRYATWSRKEVSTYTMSRSSIPYGGAASLVRYHRWVSDQCPVPPYFSQPDPRPGNPILEAVALIIQRL